jgi:hypothetical protein
MAALSFQSKISTFLQLLRKSSRTMADSVRRPWDAGRCSLCGGKGLKNCLRFRNTNLDKQPHLTYLVPLLSNLRHILYLLFSSSCSFISCIFSLIQKTFLSKKFFSLTSRPSVCVAWFFLVFCFSFRNTFFKPYGLRYFRNSELLRCCYTALNNYQFRGDPSSNPGHVRFVVDHVALGHVFSE